MDREYIIFYLSIFRFVGLLCAVACAISAVLLLRQGKPDLNNSRKGGHYGKEQNHPREPST